MGGGDSVLCALSFPGLPARSPLWAVHRMANYRDEPRTPDVDWGREKVVVVGGGFGSLVWAQRLYTQLYVQAG